MIRAREAVLLVAQREVRTRIRSKAFTIVLAVTAVLFLALPITTKLIGSGQDNTTVAVAQHDAAFATSLTTAAHRLHQKVTVRTVADAEAGRAVVSDTSADAFAVPGPNGISVTVRKSLPDDLRTLLSVLQQQSALNTQITDLGGDPDKVAGALAAVHLSVHTQEPTDRNQGQKTTVAITAGALMYMVLMIVGQMVATGVVEEKSSRVVELLLSAVKPWQLMAGKIVGIGLLGLLQLLMPGVLAVAVGIGIGELDISLSSSVGTLLWSLVWFVAGFVMYAMMFAAAGAMVSRQEDLSGLILPLLMPLIAGWIVGVSVLPTDPDSRVATILSMVPLLSPVLMPMRWALGVAPLWQALLALALTVALGVGLLRVAGRVYRNSVLRSGARVPLRDAFRAA